MARRRSSTSARIARVSHKARFEVVRDPKNRRLHGLSGLALNAERTDGYQGIIAWGGAPRQQGDLNYVLATGRAAREVFPLSSDGLGARIIGTAFNCSGRHHPLAGGLHHDYALAPGMTSDIIICGL